MHWSEKVSWRLELLRSKAAGREVVGWGAVLREVFRNHPTPKCKWSVSTLGKMLLLTAPNGVQIHWPAEYDQGFLSSVKSTARVAVSTSYLTR